MLAGGGDGGLHTASFNKWVAQFRPHLMPTQRYIQHEGTPEPWPKVGHSSLASFANAPRGRLGATLSDRVTKHRLGHKKIGNYWLSVFITDPPAMDAQRRPMPQKVVSDFYANSSEDQFATLAIASSRLMFLWWIFTADMFNVKTKTFREFPVGLGDLDADIRAELAKVGRELDERLRTPGDHWLWTPYAGEWYGNFDLRVCRDLTDKADVLLLEHLSLTDDSFDFEVEYNNYMKSGGERPGTVRGAEPDRDR